MPRSLGTKKLCASRNFPSSQRCLARITALSPLPARAWQRLVPWYQSVDSILLLSYSQKHILLLLQYKKTDTSITRKIWNCYGDQCRLASWTENEWSVTICEWPLALVRLINGCMNKAGVKTEQKLEMPGVAVRSGSFSVGVLVRWSGAGMFSDIGVGRWSRPFPTKFHNGDSKYKLMYRVSWFVIRDPKFNWISITSLPYLKFRLYAGLTT